MQIIDVVTRNHLTAAVVKGQPNDYSNEGPNLTDHLILRVGTSTYYDIDHDRMETILNRMKDPKAFVGGLLREDEEPEFDLPLVVGKVFGKPELITRQDQYYCWVVVREETIDLTAIKGLESFGKRKQYTLRYFTAPDEVFIGFVPGVGITEYKYKHHGTGDEANLKLVEAGIR